MAAKREAVKLLWQEARIIEGSRDAASIRRAYERIVEADPLHPAAWLKLSTLALSEGEYRDARNAALRSAEATLMSRRWRALPHVTLQLLHFDERVLVSRLVAASDWHDNEVLANAAVLAQRLWLADSASQALALLDHAMQLQPAHYLLHFSRGEVLNHLGRLAEAEDEYLQCIAMQPAYPHAYLSLVQNRRSDVPGSRAGIIRSALKGAERTQDLVVLNYALFHELDAAGQTDAAWAALESGASLQRQSLAYDGVGQRSHLRDLLSSFADMPAITPRQMPREEGRRHVFVVGLPRSGTTLLDRMLGNHPSVGSAGELNAFSRSMSLEMNAYYEPPPGTDIVRRALDCDWGNVGSSYVGMTSARHPDKQYLLDKNPLNVYNAGYIAQALPDARILCLARNPMDACFSNMKELFAPGSYEYSYDQRELADHYAGFLSLVECWQQRLPEHFHVVRYESLVEDPERELERALRFCGLDFDPAFVDITRNTTPVSTASSAQVREPLNKRGIDAWRRYEQQLQPLAERLAENGIRAH